MKNSKFQIPNSKLFLVLYCLIAFPSYLEAEPRIPEKLNYYVYWAGIRAGSASLEVGDSPEGITITSRVWSAALISIFYEVKDLAQSVLYPNGYPSTYILKIKEGRHRRDKTTFFGIKPRNESQKIFYHNRLDNERVEFNLERQTFDPLSGFYEIRKRQLVVGHSEYIELFDSKKFLSVEVQVLRRERIMTPAGEFNTIVIKPLLQSEGIFIKKGEIYIWLTDDERKVPVMIKSKVKIGSFVAKLVEGDY